MKVPSNYTEAEVIAIIDDVANKLCYKFKFGYHETDDIKQEAFVLALEVLQEEKYDGKRPLANFLYVHLKNRLSNFKRNKYERLEKPCDKCPLNAYVKKTGVCTAFEKMSDCDLYYQWYKRNNAKKCLMHGENLEGDLTPSHRDIGVADNELAAKEIEDYINIHLPVEFRRDYLKVKFGQKVPQQTREIIENIILEILEKGGYV